MKNAMISYIKQIKNDEYYTPEYAIEPLLKYLPKNITIWECTDYGESNITSVLCGGGYNVISTKKEDFDFLKDDPDFDFDMIITNPPYSLKDEFLKKCYEYKKPFCLLLPITSLEGSNRGNMFRKYGIEIIVFDKRIEFIKGKGNWFNTSWFCWKVLNKELIFEELKKGSDKE
jgi:hypothetical protein